MIQTLIFFLPGITMVIKVNQADGSAGALCQGRTANPHNRQPLVSQTDRIPSHALGPFVLGILWRKTNVTGAWCSIGAGTLSWIILVPVFLPLLDGETWDAIYIASVPAFVLSLVTLVIVSLRTQRSCPPKPLRDIDGNDITGGRLFVWRRSSNPSDLKTGV